MTSLGKLERVELRGVWLHEALHFTPWLASPDNLAALGQELGLDPELLGQEVSVGPYAAEIVCKDTLTGINVLIENQLEKTGSVALVIRPDCPLDDENRWPEYHDWIAKAVAKMTGVFRPLIVNLQESDLPAAASEEAGSALPA